MAEDYILLLDCPWIHTPREVMAKIADECDREGRPRPVVGLGHDDQDMTLAEALEMQGED
jgi:hypothetical protein